MYRAETDNNVESLTLWIHYLLLLQCLSNTIEIGHQILKYMEKFRVVLDRLQIASSDTSMGNLVNKVSSFLRQVICIGGHHAIVKPA